MANFGKIVKGLLMACGIGAATNAVIWGVSSCVHSRRRKALEEHIRTFHPEGENARILMYWSIVDHNDWIVVYNNNTGIRFDRRTFKYQDVYDLTTYEYGQLWWDEVPESMYSK